MTGMSRDKTRTILTRTEEDLREEHRTVMRIFTMFLTIMQM